MTSESELGAGDWKRRAALEEVENLKAIRSTFWEQHSHSLKWLMASLLAVNGGSCIAVLNNQRIPNEDVFGVGAAFVVGVLAALLIPIFGQRSIQRSMEPIQKHIGYWLSVAEDGQRSEKVESDLAAEMKAAMMFGRGAQAAGWISAMAFVAGVAIAASSLGHAS